MSEPEQEVEVKFYLTKPSALEQRLKFAGAELVQNRVHEINFRYDSPDGALTRGHRVLRLRQDYRAVLTYKGPAEADQPVSVRQEIEVEVSNFTTAQHILEALGYEVSMIYEKQRTIYRLQNVLVTLDEMPYGNFAEIEGPDAETIQAVAAQLCLVWDARCVESYLALFGRLREKHGVQARHLTFANLQGHHITPEDLGLIPADTAC